MADGMLQDMWPPQVVIDVLALALGFTSWTFARKTSEFWGQTEPMSDGPMHGGVDEARPF